jgi:hypothetical protein
MSSDNAGTFGQRGSGASASPASPIVTGAPSGGGSVWLALLFSRGGLSVVVGVILSVVAILFAGSAALNNMKIDSALQARGVETTGDVVGFYTRSGGRRSAPSLYVKYTYTAPNAAGTETDQYTDSSRIYDAQYASVANSRSVPVIYDPQSPGVSVANWNDWIHHWTPGQSLQSAFFMAGAFLFLIWFTVGLLFIRGKRRQ